MALFKFLLCGLAIPILVTAQPGFVKLPPATLDVTDPVSGIPVSVRISAFEVSPREVTQSEYSHVMGINPSARKGENLPVENVSWWEAIKYCNLRSLADKLEPCYDLTTGACDRTKNGYRLLTDAEWTYAAGKIPEGATLAQYANVGPSDTKDTRPLMQYANTHGARPVGSLQPNDKGLYDMFGNVWEWVQDYQDPAGAIGAAVNPAGPRWGVARVLRGGSYITTTSRWARDLRSSMEPDRHSPYTGFRVCRTRPQDGDPRRDEQWMAAFHEVPAPFTGQTGGLAPLAEKLDRPGEWKKRRSELRAKWEGILGTMSGSKPDPAVRRVTTHHEPNYTGELLYLQVEPDYWEKIYVMLPGHADTTRPLPVVIVPFYDVDPSAGKTMGGRQTSPPGVRSYGLLAVQHGMAAVAVRWFGQSYGENSAEVVANLKTRHPKVTGMGKWVSDSKRLLDYLATRPEFDMKNVGMIGHSLGGKMTLYATAMDDRIAAAVSSEPGIGLSFSNYEDFWYLGEEIQSLPAGTDHHELLALVAPRPFLLIGGDSADNDKSWHYINAAQEVYRLLGSPRNIGYVNHRKGHSPTPESIKLAFEWLSHFLKN